jgi:hypothetical protein
MGNAKRYITRLVAYAGGIVGYWATAALVNAANPGRREPLTGNAKRAFGLVFSPPFPAVDLDRVRLRLGARFPGIPARPQGMALGYTIYLKQPRFDEGNHADMALLLHELVHVAQYERLTPAGFARRYAEALLSDPSNERNPLEHEAYDFVQSHHAELLRAMG